MMHKYLVDFYDELTSHYNLSGKKILEVGSGDGTLLQKIETSTDAEIVGVDLVPMNNNVLRMNVENLDFQDEAFDLVISTATFEHILNPEKALEEIYRVLKPTGEFFLRFAPIWTAINGHHYNIHTQSDEIIPPWGHLYMSQNEMQTFLLEKRVSNASDICFQIYRGNSINRRSFSDYVKMFNETKYKCHINLLVRPNITKYYERLTPQQRKYCPRESLVSGFVVRSSKAEMRGNIDERVKI